MVPIGPMGIGFHNHGSAFHIKEQPILSTGLRILRLSSSKHPKSTLARTPRKIRGSTDYAPS